MLVSYPTFILESGYSECERRSGSIGRWIEEKISGNPELMQITSQFLGEIDPTIRLANAIDMLSDFDKRQVYKAVVSNGKVAESAVANAEAQTGGKNILRSFLKCITSLGLSRMEKLPAKDFLLYYQTHEVQDDVAMQSIARFRSLSTLYPATSGGAALRMYYGLDGGLTFRYGLVESGQLRELGSFALTRGRFDWLQDLSSPSIAHLKSQLFVVHHDDLVLFRKVFSFMSEYPLGKDFLATMDNATLTFMYEGVGRWDNGVVDAGEFANIKSNLKTALGSHRWHDRILLSVRADNFRLSISFRSK